MAVSQLYRPSHSTVHSLLNKGRSPRAIILLPGSPTYLITPQVDPYVVITPTFLIFSKHGTSPTTEAGGEDGEGSVHVLWGRNVRSIQPFKIAGCGVGWREGRREEEEEGQ